MDDKCGMGMRMVPAGLWPDEQFEPSMHIYYGMKIMPIKDGKPKYNKLPAAMGGDDVTCEE